MLLRILKKLHDLWLRASGWLVVVKPCRVALLMVFAVLAFLIAVPQGQDVVRALAKVEDGTYGLCDRCGALIPEERLEARPWSVLCVRCASRRVAS